KAVARKIVEVHLWDFRRWAANKHHKVDDRPYGGGPGMVLCPQPIFDCLEAVQAEGDAPGDVLLLTPAGRRLTQPFVEELAKRPRLVMLCGRYEGFDERVRLGLQPLEVSVGDFVANGGEVPAMLLIECLFRLMPNALGDENSAAEDSFSRPGWLEYPQYTRPPVFRDMAVPDVLLNGNHREIARWREEQSRLRSRDRLENSTEPTIEP
ncbi:MAG: tRNA (guanosine(37)-N1)-methyltransferase TrmD, partial [Planctomycetia bacterium]